MPCYCVKDSKGKVIRECGECRDKRFERIDQNIAREKAEKESSDKIEEEKSVIEK